MSIDVGMELTRITNRLDSMDDKVNTAVSILSSIKAYMETISKCVEGEEEPFPSMRIKVSKVDDIDG